MSTWIHVQTSDKLPVKRGTNPSPFEEFAADPNPGYGDPSLEFLPVVTDYTEPPYAPVAERLAKYRTVGVDGTYDGHYVDPDWRQEWEVIARTLDEAKQYQLGQLESDYQARLAAGFVDDGPGASGKTFELDEIHFGTLSHKKGWYDSALDSGAIPAGRKASAFAADQTRVEFQNFNKFNDFFDSYGLTFDDINELYYNKADDINAAGNITQVGNVTWDFNAL